MTQMYCGDYGGGMTLREYVNWEMRRGDAIRVELRDREVVFFFSSRRRHTRFDCDWSSDVCSSDLGRQATTLLTRITWWCAGIFLFISLVLAFMSAHSAAPRSVLEGGAPAPAPVQPTPLPLPASPAPQNAPPQPSKQSPPPHR